MADPKLIIDSKARTIVLEITEGAVSLGTLTEATVRTHPADVPTLEGRMQLALPVFVDGTEAPKNAAVEVLARLTTAALEDAIQEAQAGLQELAGLRVKTHQLEEQARALAAENAKLRSAQTPAAG